MSIGKEIYALRKQKGLSQEGLADRLQVSRQSVSLWETDQTVPSIDNLLRMCDIFGVSMDKLCGREVPPPAEDATKLPAEGSVPPGKNVSEKAPPDGENAGMVACVSSVADEAAVKELFGAQVRQTYAVYAVFIVLCLWAAVAQIAEGVYEWLAVPGVLLLIAAVGLVCTAVRWRQRRKKFSADGPHETVFRFYADRFEADCRSKSTFLSYCKNYTDVERLDERGNYVCLLVDGGWILFDREKLTGDAALALHLLRGSAKVCRSPLGKRTNERPALPERKAAVLRGVLLALFVLSLCSVLFGLLLVALIASSSPLPEAAWSMAENMWAFLVFLPLPLASLLLGVYGRSKGLRCTKNIAAGGIAAVILFVYGLFPVFFAGDLSDDYAYLTRVETAVGIELPDEGVISTQYSDGGAAEGFKDLEESVARFADGAQTEAFEAGLAGGVLWQAALPGNAAVDEYARIRTAEAEYYLIYNVQTGRYDGAVAAGENEFYFLAYQTGKNLLYVFHYLYIV